jgi:hypothetical protein
MALPGIFMKATKIKNSPNLVVGLICAFGIATAPRPDTRT